MRISELSRRSGVPTSTVKFYIRDGLLPAGALSHRNQAAYGEAHLQRLDLIKTLREVAGLPLETIREVIEQLDKPPDESDPIGPAIQAAFPLPQRDRNAAEQAEYESLRAEVDAFIRGLDWTLVGRAPDHYLNVDAVTDAVLQLQKYVDPDTGVAHLAGYADAAWLFSHAIFDSFEDHVPLPGQDLVDPTRVGILGMLLVQPLVNALLRTALAMRSMHIQADLPLPPTVADSNR